MALPLLKSFDLLQVQWKQALDPIVSNPILKGVAINSITLNATEPKTIPTTLNRMQQGWFITDILSAAKVWRTEPFNENNLVLESDIDTTISLWVY